MSFDQYALKWDNEERIDRGHKIAEAMNNRFKQVHYESALEFGCGTALIGFDLKDKFDQLRLVDSSEGMIKIANEKIVKSGSQNMKAIQIDLIHEKMTERFQVVYTSLVLHHILDIEAILSTFYGLLEDEGELCIVDIDEEDGHFHDNFPDFDGHNGFNHQDLVKKLEKVGFKNVVIETFYKAEKISKDQKVPYSLFIVNASK